jgi:hypothetical protein
MMQLFSFCKGGGRRIARCLCLWLGIFSALFAGNKVFALPEITVQPLGISISSNLPAVFTVTALQLGISKPMSVQWRRNGEIFSGGNVLTIPISVLGINVGITSTLTIPSLQPGDCGAYSVVVYDADGAVSSDVVNLSVANLLAVLTSDIFTNRTLLGGTLYNPLGGSAGANNFGTTAEPGEPENLGISGGSPVWLKWIAPANGVARFGTGGSDFDTTIGIYVKTSDRYADSVTNLTFIAGDDDSKNYFNSTTLFTAASNTEYEIMVDGFHGAQGNIVLNWSLEQTNAQIPQILTQPQSVTVGTNSRAVLSVGASSGSLSLQYQWYFNGSPLTNQTGVTLTIPLVTTTNVGQYKVAVSYIRQPTNEVIFSQPVEVQINLQGDTEEAAEAKFLDATTQTASPSVKVSPMKIQPAAAPARGYTGTQVFNTSGAASEEGAPNPCGVAGGSPYWFWYQAPAAGTLIVDASTPGFTNVLAVYTGPGDSYATLVPVACADTNAGTGHEASAFAVNNGTNYWIVVDGRNGQTGNVTLNYNLTNALAAPAISLQPQGETVAPGSNVTLTVAASGTSPLSYQWRANAMTFNGQTNASLIFSNFQSANQSGYDVVVTNSMGSATSSVANLYLNIPLQIIGMTDNSSNGFRAMLVGSANTNYIIQASSNLVNWISIATNSSPYGIISIMDTNAQNYPGRFYRALLQ